MLYEVELGSAFINANIEQAVAKIGKPQDLQPYRISADVAYKDQSSSLKEFFVINNHFQNGKFISPECPPYRPEIIKMPDMAGPFLIDQLDHTAVKSESRY